MWGSRSQGWKRDQGKLSEGGVRGTCACSLGQDSGGGESNLCSINFRILDKMEHNSKVLGGKEMSGAF